jgi:cytochrome P450
VVESGAGGSAVPIAGSGRPEEEGDEFGLFDDAVAGDARDPYPELARARREHPVQQLDTSMMPHDEALPVFFVYRFEDITRVLRDSETFSSGHIIDMIMGPVMGEHIILGMDGARHRRYRALVASAFRQKVLTESEDQLVAVVANELIDRFVDRGKAELVREFTFPYPTKVIAGILGLPPEDYRQFQRWSIAILSFLANQEDAIAASREIEGYMAGILADRRSVPRDDLISGLAQAELDGERLGDDEIFSFLRLLLPAGVETTFRSTGNLLYLLLSHPEQLEAVRSDRTLIPDAIEEAVRLETPLLNITRLATKDTDIGGVAVPAGSTVMVMLAAANREDDRYGDPDAFDIFRKNPKPHVSFGHGPHVCLGMHLARVEMRVALNLLLDRLPDLRLDPEADDPHIRGQVFRSPTSLPVLFTR